MIRSFRHAGIEELFLTRSKAGIQLDHAPKLRRPLQALNFARRAQDMNQPGWHFHALQGELKGFWSVKVNGNWRITFGFEEEDAVLVDYLDYH
jgi:proteic killer suppression protein